MIKWGSKVSLHLFDSVVPKLSQTILEVIALHRHVLVGDLREKTA